MICVRKIRHWFSILQLHYVTYSRKWNKISFSIYHLCESLHADLRGAHAALKLSEGLLWGKKVIVLVLEVVQLQITRSIHTEQLVPCGRNKKVRELQKEPRGHDKNWEVTGYKEHIRN